MRKTMNKLVLLCLFVLVPAAQAQLRYAGSDTVEPLVDAAKLAYQRTNPGFTLSSSSQGTSAGFRELCSGRIVFAGASRQIKPDELASCVSKSITPVEVPVAADAIVLITSKQFADIGALTLAEVGKLFAPASGGTLTKWRQLRANLPDAALSTSGVDVKHGTFEFFHGAIGNNKYVRSDIKSTTKHDDTVKYVLANPGAIGYVSLAVATDYLDKVRIIPINFGKGPAVVPDVAAVRSGTYAALSRTVYVYVNAVALAKNETDLGFVRFMVVGAEKYASFAGLIALNADQYKENTKRVAFIVN
jgi:phosphate transport system substrate-binding protein